MKIIDKVLSKQFQKHQRERLLSVIINPQKRWSKAWFQQRWYRMLLRHVTNQGLFTLFYDQNLWNNPESVSGPGSTLEATREIRDALPRLLKTYHIRSVLDIPCGDFHWMQSVNLHQTRYIGGDIVKALIEKNSIRYSSEKHCFKVLDLIRDPLPQVDLVLCRDGMVHLSDKEIMLALKNIRKSGSRYLLATSFPDKPVNVDPGITHWRPLNLQQPPFGLPPPLEIIHENEKDGRYVDKSLCLWKLDTLTKI